MFLASSVILLSVPIASIRDGLQEPLPPTRREQAENGKDDPRDSGPKDQAAVDSEAESVDAKDPRKGTVESEMEEALRGALNRSTSALESIGRAEAVLDELTRRIQEKSLDPEVGGKVQGQVLGILHGALGTAQSQSQQVLDRTRAEVIPNLDAFVSSLDRELEVRELSKEKAKTLLEFRKDAISSKKKIEHQGARLQARIGYLREIRSEVWEMMDTHSKRLELMRLTGQYLQSLKQLNNAIDALRLKWQEAFQIDA